MADLMYDKGQVELVNPLEEKINNKVKNKYTSTFKNSVARTILKGEASVKEVSKDLHISRIRIKKWVRDFAKQYKPEISIGF
jgi:transposase-like protein